MSDEARTALARSFCRWLLPDDDTSHDGRLLGRNGQWWHGGRAEVERCIAALPSRSLAAVAELPERRLHPAAEGAVLSLVKVWCAYSDEQRELINSDISEGAQDLAAALLLADIVSSVAAVTDKLPWTEVRMVLRETIDAYCRNRFRVLGLKRLPLRGILYAEPADIHAFRALALGILLATRIVPGQQLTRAVYALLDEHLERHEEIARVAKECQTLDPVILGAVLASDTRALSDGAL